MPYNLHIVTVRDFVQLDARGCFDLEKSRHGLERIAKACVDSGVFDALLDVRDTTSPLALADLYTLARAFPDMGFTHRHRLAILHRSTAGMRPEFFADRATERGWNVRAFDDFEEAIRWFNASQPAIDAGSSSISPVK